MPQDVLLTMPDEGYDRASVPRARMDVYGAEYTVYRPKDSAVAAAMAALQERFAQFEQPEDSAGMGKVMQGVTQALHDVVLTVLDEEDAEELVARMIDPSPGERADLSTAAKLVTTVQGHFAEDIQREQEALGMAAPPSASQGKTSSRKPARKKAAAAQR